MRQGNISQFILMPWRRLRGLQEGEATSPGTSPGRPRGRGGSSTSLE